MKTLLDVLLANLPPTVSGYSKVQWPTRASRGPVKEDGPETIGALLRTLKHEGQAADQIAEMRRMRAVAARWGK